MNTVNSVPVSGTGNRGLDRLREIRAGAEPAAPACTSCSSPVADPNDVLCPACYQLRRGPGRVLRFDPDRRRRTALRLADRPCRDCHTTSWHVTPRGDASCQTCARKRVVGAP